MVDLPGAPPLDQAFPVAVMLQRRLSNHAWRPYSWAVTSVDEVNLVSCMSVRGSAELVKVARVSNPDFYVDGAHLKPEMFGVDVMINPARELALETLRLLQATANTSAARANSPVDTHSRPSPASHTVVRTAGWAFAFMA